MSNHIISQQLNTQEITPNGQTPIATLHQAIDTAIKQLLGFKAQLLKAQMAGLETVDLEDPNTGKLYRVGIDLAIEAVDFAAKVKSGGAA